MQWGVSVIAILVLLLLGSAVFKYPDIISAEITLTGTIPPAGIVAKTTGKIDEFLVEDNQLVSFDQWLAVIDNPANTRELIYLRHYLDTLDLESNGPLPPENLNLGTLQSQYYTFYALLYDYDEFRRLNYYPSKITMSEERIGQYEVQYKNLAR
ncbi:MAG: hypothetical protein LUD68_01700 [Rikenellaceae bacterium]|nr:hypothetical protein [Rikenellaceae bacterium]